LKYRPDIDGLRAVAIVPVVLYHAGIGVFSGGFVGVDVFFVISGFLISGLIQSEIDAGKFSILSFYERRIRRIFPALFAVILATSVAALLTLSPADLVSFAASAAAAALFVSNMLFAHQSGYFAAPAELKPLLHTWSLGVEEQFYLLFPAFLLLLRRRSKAQVGAAVALIAAASFAASVYFVRQHPESAFYLGPWRIWELSLGVLAALGAIPLFRHQSLREIASVLGLALVAWSATALTRADPFPGINALYPCIGTLLVIQAGNGGRSVMNSLLASRVFVFIGLISYSLYLWHWPLIVFAKRLLFRPLTGREIIVVVALSLLLAVLSWKFVEKPFRLRHGQRPQPVKAVLCAAIAIGLAAAFFVAARQSQGWPGRFDQRQATHVRGREDYRVGSCFLNMDQTYPDWARSGPCLVDNHAAQTVLIWGDSFGAHYIPGIDQSPRTKRYNFVLYTAYSCPPVLAANVPWAPRCHDVNADIGKVLDRYPPSAVVVVARWERYWNASVKPADVQATLAVLKARGLPVVLVGQGPSFTFSDPVDFVRLTGQQTAESKDHSEMNAQLRALRGYDVFFDPNQSMCPNGSCALTDHGAYLYWDDGHYSSHGSVLAADGLMAAIRAALLQDTDEKTQP
jgi:peptidoglycan/LPS O-acetylase OafA/YrhL